MMKTMAHGPCRLTRFPGGGKPVFHPNPIWLMDSHKEREKKEEKENFHISLSQLVHFPDVLRIAATTWLDTTAQLDAYKINAELSRSVRSQRERRTNSGAHAHNFSLLFLSFLKKIFILNSTIFPPIEFKFPASVALPLGRCSWKE